MTTRTEEMTGTFGDEEDEAPTTNVDDLLGATAPALRWPEIGTKAEGTIVAIGRGIQREPDGTVKTWDDGSVRLQAILTLQTLGEPETADDDLQRRLFVKGTMVRPFREAMRRAHVRGPRVGGYISVTFTGETKPTKKGMNPAKEFSVAYTPPGR